MKIFEPAIPYIGVIFTISGLILGSYLTVNFRKKSLIKLDEIKEIDSIINNSLDKLSSLNASLKLTQDRIDKITSNTEVLVKESNDISKGIIQKTDLIAEIQSNLERITDKNLYLSKESQTLVQELTNFQTGGDTYGLLRYDYFKGTNRIIIRLSPISNSDRKYTLRNVSVTFVDETFRRNTPRKTYKLHSQLPLLKMHANDGRVLRMDIGDIRPNNSPILAELNSNDYKNGFIFNFMFTAENISTQQQLIVYDFRSRNPLIYSSIVLSNGERREVLKEEVSRNFPLTENGTPDYPKVMKKIKE